VWQPLWFTLLKFGGTILWERSVNIIWIIRAWSISSHSRTLTLDNEDGWSLSWIRKGQLEDRKIDEIKCNIKEEKSSGFTEDDQGILWYKERICVPNVNELKYKILQEAHKSSYSIYWGGNKMYHDLKAIYWWYEMKRDVALCNNCQRVKVEHQWPAGLLQPLQVPEWKWEEIAMDFIVCLPRTQSGYDSI
jgi:hypothetical protein